MLIKAPDHTLSRQGKIDLYPQPFTVEVVQDIQQPKCTTVTQPVGHEIHGPGHIGRIRHRQRVGLVPFQSLAGLDPKVQFELAIDAVNPFVVPWVPLDVAQMQKTQPKGESAENLRFMEIIDKQFLETP